MSHPLIDVIFSRISDLRADRKSLKDEVDTLTQAVQQQRAQFDELSKDKALDDQHIVDLENTLKQLQDEASKSIATSAEDEQEEKDVQTALGTDDYYGQASTPENAAAVAAKVTSTPVTTTNIPDSAPLDSVAQAAADKRAADSESVAQNGAVQGFK